jgi:succinate-semialdehyde dehydrogenase/glutarate-semialdehyde dehydrogenase
LALQTINPATGALVRDYAEASDDEIAAMLSCADRAFQEWRRAGFADRARSLRQAAQTLEARKDELGRLMAVEMGKPFAQGRAEAEKCAWVCRYYADNAEAFLGRESVATDASKSFIAFQPLGAVLAVMPWNFPLWQVFRFAAPALMAGNVGLLKHSSNVSGCALAIEEILHGAGVPKGAFRTLLIGSPRVARVVAAPEVKAVTLTGSTPAGKAVAAKAGEMLKKTVLELGGSDAYVVLEDAELEAAAEACCTSRLINSGQSCVAAKRFIVVDAVRYRFQELFVGKMKEKRLGDPLEAGGATCAMTCTSRCTGRSRAAPARCSAARSRRGRAPTTRRACSRTSRPACPRSTRSCSGPSRRSWPPRTRPTRSASPT